MDHGCGGERERERDREETVHPTQEMVGPHLHTACLSPPLTTINKDAFVWVSVCEKERECVCACVVLLLLPIPLLLCVTIECMLHALPWNCSSSSHEQNDWRKWLPFVILYLPIGISLFIKLSPPSLLLIGFSGWIVSSIGNFPIPLAYLIRLKFSSNQFKKISFNLCKIMLSVYKYLKSILNLI